MKLTIMKSGKDERLYIQKTITKNDGKSATKNVKCLGSVSELMSSLNSNRDQIISWAKEQVDELTKAEKEDKKNVIIQLSQTTQIESDVRRSYKGGYLFLQSLYYDLRFDNTFRNIKNRNNFEYDIDAIFADLVFSRILSPSSKLSSYNIAKSFLEPPKYKIHDVYRALSVIAKESDYIQSEIFKNSNLITKRKTGVLFYDCTNYYFEIENEDGFKKYGKGKEHRPNPIVQMGLFMDTDGIPLAFCLFDGNKNEQKSLIPLEEKIIQNYDFNKFIVCTDAGLSSYSNKMFNSVSERAYIVTQSIKKLSDANKEWVFKDEGWKRMSDKASVKLEDIKKLVDDDNLYYKVEPYKEKEIENQSLIVTYSPIYAKYQKNIRDKQVARALNLIKDNKYQKSRNENDPRRFIKEEKTTINGEVAEQTTLSFDNSVLIEEQKYDGLYACTTDLDDDVKDIIKIVKGRWEIEECFRIMKTDFEARPIYLQREDRIQAHFLTCFTALLLIRLLEHKTEHKYNINKLIETLRSYDFLKFDEGYVPSYTRNEITDKLHEVFNFRADYQIITKSSMRSIIKKTKE